jgi:hypothetical protein
LSSQTLTTDVVLAKGLSAANTENTRAVLSNPDAFAFLLNMFNGTLGMASGSKADIVLGFAGKSLATTDVVAKMGGAKGVQLTSSAIQIMLSNASLISLAGNAHPGAVIATVGATLATKTSLALGMAGGDDKKAACIAAAADLVAAGSTLTAGVITTSTGVGAVTGIGPLLIASSIASVMLNSYKVHQACIKKP